MKKIILIGCGGHFNSCLDIIQSLKKFKIYGYVDKKKKDNSLKYLGNDKLLKKLNNKSTFFHISLGQITNFEARSKLFDKLQKMQFKFPKLVSKRSVISKSAQIGDGTIVMNGVNINSNVKIGKNCIINTGAIIEHDAIIGDHCHISTGAIINGGAKIGSKTFVGSGTVIRQEIKIGNKCFINANLFINKNLKKNQFKK